MENMVMAAGNLLGRSILLAEEDRFAAGYIGSAILGCGAQVIGPLASLTEALAQLNEDLPAAAALNVSLSDGPSWPLADALARLGIPFLFLADPGRCNLPSHLREAAVLTKPFAAYQVCGALDALLRERDTAPVATP
jgi:DNA-binding response OmpR family regulator